MSILRRIRNLSYVALEKIQISIYLIFWKKTELAEFLNTWCMNSLLITHARMQNIIINPTLATLTNPVLINNKFINRNMGIGGYNQFFG